MGTSKAAKSRKRSTSAVIGTGTGSRTDRAAGAVLALEGLFLLVLGPATVAQALPLWLSTDPIVSFEIGLPRVLSGLALTLFGLLTLVLAWRLWRGGPAARVVATGLVALAGLYAGTALSGFGNVLWAMRSLVADPDRLLLRWPYLYWDPFLGSNVSGTPVENFPSGRLDDIAFWFPGLVALGALLVAAMLLAGWIGRRARGAQSGPVAEFFRRSQVRGRRVPG